MIDRVAAARELMESDPDAAHALCQDVLRDDPDNALALFMTGVLMIRADRQGTAIPIFEKVVKLRPERIEAWNYLGMAWQECHNPVKAREAFRRGHEIKPSCNTMGNIGVTYLDEGNPVEAIRWVNKALAADPNFNGGRATLGFAQLSTGNWAEGWKNYEACLGGRFRKKLDFGAPDWHGDPVDKLIIYGEQGLGDEIMFASCIADAQKLAKHITLECDPRLEGLFKRSFPDVEVHGTRRMEQPWREGRTFDAQVACASLASIFRPSPMSCPKTPYLVPDHERRVMWRALFDEWKKPVIGLCWSGGRPASQRHKREIGVEAFAPLIESVDAVFVSLQYRDPKLELEQSNLPIRTFPAAMSNDYDDLAAMVYEMDYIVGIHTTVHHLAGAMGKASRVLVPQSPMWNYFSGDRLAWYKDNIFHRQKKDEKWSDCVKRIELDPHLYRVR